MLVRSFSWMELVSRNCALNLSICYDGIGFSILGVCGGGWRMALAISKFCGMWRWTGR
jgi:hypothetical protein